MKFKLKGGMHEDENGRQYYSGDIIETDVAIDEIHGKKFVRCHEDELPEKVKEKAPVDEKKVAAEKKKAAATKERAIAFEGATEAGLLVMAVGNTKLFNVYDDGTLVNAKPVDERAVKKLIKELSE